MSDKIRFQDYADAFAESIGGEGAQFTRNDLADWLGVGPDLATRMLQAHKYAHGLLGPEFRPKYVFERNGFGRGSEWKVARPQDAPDIIRRSAREKTDQILRDIELRAEPAAMRSKRAQRDIEVMVGAVEFAVAYLMKTLGVAS